MTFAEKWAFRAFFNSLLNKLGKNRVLIHSCLFSHFKENFEILDIQYQNLGNTCCPKIQKIFSCPKVAPLQISCHYHHWIQKKKSIPKVSRLENSFWKNYVHLCLLIPSSHLISNIIIIRHVEDVNFSFPKSLCL